VLLLAPAAAWLAVDRLGGLPALGDRVHALTARTLGATTAASPAALLEQPPQPREAAPVAAAAPVIDPAPAPATDAPAAAQEDAPAPPTSDAAAAAVPSTMGLLETTDLLGGRRIFVDEATVGETPASVLVKCGARSVRIGSAGQLRTIDVPCGGAIRIPER
jgi:serine/threonine-protein kinase